MQEKLCNNYDNECDTICRKHIKNNNFGINMFIKKCYNNINSNELCKKFLLDHAHIHEINDMFNNICSEDEYIFTKLCQNDNYKFQSNLINKCNPYFNKINSNYCLCENFFSKKNNIQYNCANIENEINNFCLDYNNNDLFCYDYVKRNNNLIRQKKILEQNCSKIENLVNSNGICLNEVPNIFNLEFIKNNLVTKMSKGISTNIKDNNSLIDCLNNINNINDYKNCINNNINNYKEKYYCNEMETNNSDNQICNYNNNNLINNLKCSNLEINNNKDCIKKKDILLNNKCKLEAIYSNPECMFFCNSADKITDKQCSNFTQSLKDIYCVFSNRNHKNCSEYKNLLLKEHCINDNNIFLDDCINYCSSNVSLCSKYYNTCNDYNYYLSNYNHCDKLCNNDTKLCSNIIDNQNKLKKYLVNIMNNKVQLENSNIINQKNTSEIINKNEQQTDNIDIINKKNTSEIINKNEQQTDNIINQKNTSEIINKNEQQTDNIINQKNTKEIINNSKEETNNIQLKTIINEKNNNEINIINIINNYKYYIIGGIILLIILKLLI